MTMGSQQIMQEKIRTRIDELRSELQRGTARLRELESQSEELRQTLLRIAGAIQVLEELLQDPSNTDAGGAAEHRSPNP